MLMPLIEDRFREQPGGPIVPFDQFKVEKAIGGLLSGMGLDPEADGLKNTPNRVARMYQELPGGLQVDPTRHLSRFFHDAHNEIVILRDIDFYSLCERHLLSFFGKAHVAYLPSKKIVGLSKLARTVETFARRPQVQERLTAQIADALIEHLDAKGSMVVLEAQHLCMKIRGVQKPIATMVSSALRGVFKDNTQMRAEALSLIWRDGRSC